MTTRPRRAPGRERRPATIAILGHVGNRNHGDEGIVRGLVDNLRRRRPDARIVGFTLRPEDMRERHGIEAHPSRRPVPEWSPPGGEGGAGPAGGPSRPGTVKRLVAAVPGLEAVARPAVRALRAGVRLPGTIVAEARFLASGFRRLRGGDLLIVAGSEQIMDGWGGPWAYPYTLMKWCLMARARGARVAYASVGSTPLASRLSRLFHRVALRSASYRSYRDEGSKELVGRIYPVEDDPVMPDLVFSLNVDLPPDRDPGPRPRVLINPMAVFTGQPPLATRAAYESYIDGLARLIEWLRGRGREVELFITQERVDPVAVDDLRSAVSAIGGDPDLVVRIPGSAREVFDLVAGADYVIGTRFHGILFSLAACTPTLAVAYRRKARELMQSLGQQEFVVDVADASFGRLRELFLRLEERRDEQARRLRDGVPRFRALLDRQYDVLTDLAEAGPPEDVASAAPAAPALR